MPPRGMPEKAPELTKREQTQLKSFKATLAGTYLAGYNLVSAILWSIILGRVISIAPVWGNAELMRTTGSYIRWTQTLAALEIVHSAFGTWTTFPTIYLV